jgi:hypothetical protein
MYVRTQQHELMILMPVSLRLLTVTVRTASSYTIYVTVHNCRGYLQL